MFVNAYEPTPNEGLDSILTNAGLNWKLQRVMPAIRPLGYQKGVSDPCSFQPLEDFRFLRRSDNGKVFAASTKAYRPHQNHEIFGAIMESAQHIGTHVTRVGSLKEGSWVFAQVDMGKSFQLSSRDRVRGLLTITTRHDGGGATRAGGSSISIICQNTFMMASRQLAATLTHRSSMDRNETMLQDALKSAADDFLGYSRDAQKLAASPVKSKQALLDWVQRVTDPAAADARDAKAGRAPVDITADRIDSISLDAILDAQTDRAASAVLVEDMLNRQGKAILEAIVEGVGQDDPARKGTWWGAVNGVTYWTNYTAQARSPENRMASGMVGPNARLASRALELAIAASEASQKAA